MRTLKALNKDNVTLTKDCSTQVELEMDLQQEVQNLNEPEVQKLNEEVEEAPTPKKVFKLTLFINKSKFG